MEIIAAVITDAMGDILVASASFDYFTLPLNWWQRIVVLFCGFSLFGPTSIMITAVGVGLCALGVPNSSVFKQKASATDELPGIFSCRLFLGAAYDNSSSPAR